MSECDKFQSVAIEIDKQKREKHQEEIQTEEKKHREERHTKKGRMITSYQFEQKILKIKKETNIESLS